MPIYDRPMVTYAIESMVKAGVTEVMLVTGGAHAGESIDASDEVNDFVRRFGANK